MVNQGDPKIKLQNVAVGYNKSGVENKVLTNLNFAFYSGELTGVVGLNGIGKSTLLKSMCGLLPILNGQIEVEGIEVSDAHLNHLSKKISIVLTEKFGGFNLKVWDVVASGLSPYTNAFHHLNEEALKIVGKAMQQCGLEPIQQKLIDELSDGYFQKTLIAKTLAQQTPVMLLDEPSAFLDYASKHELFILLKNLAEQQHKCILVSSHDLDLLLKYCHKLLIIDSQQSTLINVEEVKTNEAFLKITKGFL